MGSSLPPFYLLVTFFSSCTPTPSPLPAPLPLEGLLPGPVSSALTPLETWPLKSWRRENTKKGSCLLFRRAYLGKN